MKHQWLNDAILIRQELDRIVNEKTPLICGRRGVKDLTKLPVKGITRVGTAELLVLHHPHEPTCSETTCSFYYPVEGGTLRFFQCERVKKADKYVGFKIPEAIYNLYNRHYPRVDTPDSRVTFAILNKNMIYNADVENISSAGAKITGKLPASIDRETMLVSLSFALQMKSQVAVETNFHVPEAKVVWTRKNEHHTLGLGVCFTLPRETGDALANYIDFRSIEDQS